MFARAVAVGERYGSLYQRLVRKYLLKFNDVYLLMPELMNQQTITVFILGNFISIEIMSGNIFVSNHLKPQLNCYYRIVALIEV